MFTKVLLLHLTLQHKEEWREKEKGKIGLHLVHPVVIGYVTGFSGYSSFPFTHTHNSPVAQAGRHISVVPAGLGTGTSAGAAESQPPVSSSSPPVLPSPSPPPADGCTPLVSVIHSAHGRRR